MAIIEENDQVSVFPNPSDGMVKVNAIIGLGQTARFELSNNLGQLVFSQQLSSGYLHQLNLGNLQQGLYFYRLIQNGTQTAHGKIILH